MGDCFLNILYKKSNFKLKLNQIVILHIGLLKIYTKNFVVPQNNMKQNCIRNMTMENFMNAFVLMKTIPL